MEEEYRWRKSRGGGSGRGRSQNRGGRKVGEGKRGEIRRRGRRKSRAKE